MVPDTFRPRWSVDAIKSFCADRREVLVPELNYEGQFAHLLTGITGCAMQRFKLCVPSLRRRGS